MSALADTTNTITQEKEDVAKTTVVDKADVTATVVESSAEKASAEETKVVENSEVSADSETEKKEVAEAGETTDKADAAAEPAPVVEDAKAQAEPSADTAMEEATPELSREEMIKKYEEHVITGRRFMKTNVFDQATEAFSLAAAIVAELHGEASEQTFEVNFLYGKALLELAKIEDEILTNALTDIPKGDDEVQDDVVENPDDVPQEERDEIKQKVEEALGTEVTIVEETTEEQKTSATDEKDEKVVESVETTEDGSKADEEEQKTEKETPEVEKTAEVEDVEMETAEEQEAEDPEAEQPEEGSETDEDEPIRLAWEILETSRCICEKKLKSLEAEEKFDAKELKTWKLNHADVLTSLGEHGMVDSKYELAQKDLAEAISIQKAELPATSRILANTTHLLAKAFNLDSVFEKAATHFSDSKNILIAKTEELKKQLETAAEGEKSDIEAEIKELEELIPELDVFVNDARASAVQTEQIKEAAKKELAAVAEDIAKLSGEETKDITDMVRRPTKRPASEEPVEEIKKRKSEEAVETIPDEKPMETSEESESAPTPVAPIAST